VTEKLSDASGNLRRQKRPAATLCNKEHAHTVQNSEHCIFSVKWFEKFKNKS